MPWEERPRLPGRSCLPKFSGKIWKRDRDFYTRKHRNSLISDVTVKIPPVFFHVPGRTKEWCRPPTVFLASLKGNGGKDTSQNAILSNDGTPSSPSSHNGSGGKMGVSQYLHMSPYFSFFAFCLAIFHWTSIMGEKANAHSMTIGRTLTSGLLIKISLRLRLYLYSSIAEHIDASPTHRNPPGPSSS